MIKIGICDDERMIAGILKDLVRECMRELEAESEVRTFDSGGKLLTEAGKLDILFLDIEMPGSDGIEVGRKLREQGYDCRIIMATSKAERFKDAFKINAFRFITKPFQKEEIKEALEAVLKTRVGMGEIELYRERNLYTFLQKDIICMMAVNSAVEFMLKEGIFRKETSLTDLEKVLDDRLFYRINKQCIVNMREIRDYRNGKILINEIEMKVSIRRKKEFEKAYMMFDVNYR